MFCKKEHLSVEGFMKAVSYINSLNKPLEPETLKSITEKGGRRFELAKINKRDENNIFTI